MYHVLSDEGRTDAINKILEKSGLNPTGEFYLWVAKIQLIITKTTFLK